MLFKSVLNTEP